MTTETKTKIDYIFAVLESSGVSMADFARLTKVSRASLYNWKNGNNVTDKLRLRDAYAFATRLAKAVELKKLPLIGMYRMSERQAVLLRIIAEANQALAK